MLIWVLVRTCEIVGTAFYRPDAMPSDSVKAFMQIGLLNHFSDEPGLAVLFLILSFREG